jgi:hypothetical protein
MNFSESIRVCSTPARFNNAGVDPSTVQRIAALSTPQTSSRRKTIASTMARISAGASVPWRAACGLDASS